MQVVFRDESGTRLDSVALGEFGINGQYRRNFTVNISQRPEQIELLREVEADPDTEWSIIGLEWDGDEYKEVPLRSDPDPWYC